MATPTTIRPRDPASDLALLAVELSDVRARLAKLEAVEAERRRRRLLPGDPRLLARLLPAISGQWGHESFSARDVTDDPRLSSVVQGRSVKSLGKLFARATDVPIGRYVLVACGTEDGARRYRVDLSSGL